jgi:DNA-binding MurR/RpiR family transcriptional regulator
MTYEERIRAAYPQLSKSFGRLADFLLDSYIEAAFMTATELGHAVNVDATTVVRFSQQLGYAGYPELLREIRDKIKSQILTQPENTSHADNLNGVIDSSMRELENLFEQTRRLLDPAPLSRLIQKIHLSDRVFLIPDSHTRLAAYTLLNALERGRYTAVTVPSTALDLARALRLASPQSLLLAIETGAEASQTAEALRAARQGGIPTAAILGAASLPAAQAAETVLFAQAQPSIETSAMLLNAIAYVIGQSLRWQFPQRFQHADEDISELAARLQQPPA